MNVRFHARWSTGAAYGEVGEVLDISVGGVFLKTETENADLKPGTWIRLVISVPHMDSRMRFLGEVKWSGCHPRHRCKGVGQWNKYTVVAVDGTVKLAINGRFVNSIRDASWKKGYICLESEGREVHMRNIRIMELPPGMADETTSAPTSEAK